MTAPRLSAVAAWVNEPITPNMVACIPRSINKGLNLVPPPRDDRPILPHQIPGHGGQYGAATHCGYGQLRPSARTTSIAMVVVQRSLVVAHHVAPVGQSDQRAIASQCDNRSSKEFGNLLAVKGGKPRQSDRSMSWPVRGGSNASRLSPSSYLECGSHGRSAMGSNTAIQRGPEFLIYANPD
jgi:hypothetical protein